MMAPDSNRQDPPSPGPKLVPAVEHFDPPGQDSLPDLTPVIQSFARLGTLEDSSRAGKALVLAGVRLLRLWHGEGPVQELRDRFPPLFVELDRLDRELTQSPRPPAPPLPPPIPVEAPSIIFHGRAGADSRPNDVAEAEFSGDEEVPTLRRSSGQERNGPDVLICYGEAPRPGIFRRLITWLLPGR